MHTPETQSTPAHPPISYTRAELKKILDLSTVTLWRLEKRGLLLPVPGLRRKIYSAEAVQRFLKGPK